MPDLVLPVSEKEWKEAGSKFIAFPPDAKVGDVQFRNVELGLPDWDTPGKSIKFPVTVTSEGEDEGKKEKISCGVDARGVWKLKAVLKNLGIEYTLVNKKVAFNTDAVAGKAAVGIWTLQEGKKGGEATGEKVLYPKLTDIMPEGTQPQSALL